MAVTELLRIAKMSQDERTFIIGMLTPAERKEILLRAAQEKQRAISERMTTDTPSSLVEQDGKEN